MGKTETPTGGVEVEKQIGLFGYSTGLQSIFLDAETGDAIFGLPNNKIIEIDSKTKEKIPKSVSGKEANYSEGRIELKPGGISSIGG
jgi:hypothetical protein